MHALGEARESQDPATWRPKLRYAGTFFGLGRLFFALGHILNHFLLILNAFWSLVLPFFACWDAQNMILEGPGKVLEALKPCFSFVFRISEHALPSCSQYNKTVIFARFYRLQSTAHTAKTNVFCVALKAFLDMVPEWLPKIPAGIHFLVFASTLQRGGTCEAHGIGSKSNLRGCSSALWDRLKLTVFQQ